MYSDVETVNANGSSGSAFRAIVSRSPIPEVDKKQIVERFPIPNQDGKNLSIPSQRKDATCPAVTNPNGGELSKGILAESNPFDSYSQKKFERFQASLKLPLKITTDNSDNKVREKKISAMDVAYQLASSYHFGIYEDDIYVFDENHYKKCSNKKLEHLAYLALKRSNISLQTYKFIQDVRNFLILETMYRSFSVDDVAKVSNYIGFANGYLQLDTLKFIPPNPQIFITNFINITIEPYLLKNVVASGFKKVSCSNFDNFIWSLADGNPDIFDRIYEMIGYLVSNDCAAKKLFVLGGVSDSGKSKLGEFITNFFNEGATVAIRLGDLGEKFSIGNLPGKALCFDLDLPMTKIDSKTAAALKGLTGGDATSAERKFEQQQTFVNRAKFLYATNHPIEFTDHEYVLRNRFVYIPITQTVPKERQRKDLLADFKNEKNFIILKSIGYYLDLVKNKYEFTGDFPLNSAFIHANNGISMPMEDMIKKFAAEKCSFVSLGKWEYTDALYEAFCNCNRIELKDSDYKSFSRMFFRLFSDRVEKVKKRRDNVSAPLSAFNGVSLKVDY